MADLTKPQPPTPGGRSGSMLDVIDLLNSVLGAVETSARDSATTATAAADLSTRMAVLGIRDVAAALADFRDRVDMLSVNISNSRDLVHELLTRAQRIRFGAKADGGGAEPPGQMKVPG